MRCVSTHILRIPSHRTDWLSAQNIERQALLLRLDVPDRHESPTAAGSQDVRYLLIPVYGLKVVGAGRGSRPQSKWVCDVVQVGDEELYHRQWHLENMSDAHATHLCLRAGRSQKLGAKGIELQ